MNNPLGKRATFVPYVRLNREGGNAGLGVKTKVTGVVTYVNKPHNYFTATYSIYGETIRESFKFSQIGKDVTIRG